MFVSLDSAGFNSVAAHYAREMRLSIGSVDAVMGSLMNAVPREDTSGPELEQSAAMLHAQAHALMRAATSVLELAGKLSALAAVNAHVTAPIPNRGKVRNRGR